MKTCKKLLAIALVAAVLLTTLVSGLVVSAADANTLVIGTTEIVKGTATADVEFTLTYAEATKAPHSLCTITADEGLTLTALTLGAVDYVKVGDTVVDDELVADAAKITIDDNGKNIAAGKVLFESAVDSNAPTVKSIKFVATFAVADPDAIAEYNVTAAIDATNYDEADVAIDVTAGKVSVVEPPHVCDGTILENNGDGTHAVKCECGKVVTAAVACTYVDGFCACGAEEPVAGPVVDKNLVFYRTSLAYGTSSLELNFRIANTVLALYDDVEVVIVPQKYDMTTLNLVETPAEIAVKKADLAAAGSRYMQYTYTDIMLYELGLDIDYMMKGYDAEGNLVAVSETFSTSIADFLKTMSNDASQAAGFRALMVDTLVVCDEVMKNVAASYPTSDLAKATSVLEGADLTLATKELGECNTVDECVSYDDAFGQTSGLTHQIRSSVAIGKVPYINFRVRDAKNALDLSKLEVNVKYTSKDKAGEHPYDKTFSGSDLTDGTFINCTFAEIGFHDSDKDILFTVSYDGVKKCEWTYSIETYLSGKTTDATIGAQSIALIKLGQAFRSYQGL